MTIDKNEGSSSSIITMPKPDYSDDRYHLPPQRRSVRFPAWLFIPLGAIGYTMLCVLTIGFAWGMRGAPKPQWYWVIWTLALPGMGSPFIVAPLLGGMLGFGIFWISLLKGNKKGNKNLK